MLKRFVALLLGLAVAAPAAPQGIPNFLPAQTVVGRLASNPGPTSAIPFATLAAQLGVGSSYLVATNISGTNAITGTTTGAAVLATNQVVFFVPANTNTSTTTFNRDSTGAVNVFWNGAATAGGEIVAGIPVALFYDGTQYNIMGGVPNSDADALSVNASDRTKKLKLSLSGITTATTRTVTVADLNFAIGKQPTRQVLTSGSSATYTTPSGATRINVRMCGGGGGGGAQSTNAGTAGNSTTFSTLTAGGGGAGAASSGSAGASGTASGGDINIAGAPGQPGGGSGTAGVSPAGGAGGQSLLGGGGSGGVPGGAGGDAPTNSCGGGGGGGGNGTNAGSGGGSGGYVEKLITSPSSTYTYTIGAAVNGGASGGVGGGHGAAGLVIVDEYYN